MPGWQAEGAVAVEPFSPTKCQSTVNTCELHHARVGAAPVLQAQGAVAVEPLAPTSSCPSTSIKDLNKLNKNKKLFKKLAQTFEGSALSAFRAEFADLRSSLREIANATDISWLVLLTTDIDFEWIPTVHRFIEQQDAEQHPANPSDIQKLLLAKLIFGIPRLD